MKFPSPESGIINSFLVYFEVNSLFLWFPSPESGIINSFSSSSTCSSMRGVFPSPESGIINSFYNVHDPKVVCSMVSVP